jgi:hypothetical protein
VAKDVVPTEAAWSHLEPTWTSLMVGSPLSRTSHPACIASGKDFREQSMCLPNSYARTSTPFYSTISRFTSSCCAVLIVMQPCAGCKPSAARETTALPLALCLTFQLHVVSILVAHALPSRQGALTVYVPALADLKGLSSHLTQFRNLVGCPFRRPSRLLIGILGGMAGSWNCRDGLKEGHMSSW